MELWTIVSESWESRTGYQEHSSVLVEMEAGKGNCFHDYGVALPWGLNL